MLSDRILNLFQSLFYATIFSQHFLVVALDLGWRPCLDKRRHFVKDHLRLPQPSILCKAHIFAEKAQVLFVLYQSPTIAVSDLIGNEYSRFCSSAVSDDRKWLRIHNPCVQSSYFIVEQNKQGLSMLTNNDSQLSSNGQKNSWAILIAKVAVCQTEATKFVVCSLGNIVCCTDDVESLGSEQLCVLLLSNRRKSLSAHLIYLCCRGSGKIIHDSCLLLRLLSSVKTSPQQDIHAATYDRHPSEFSAASAIRDPTLSIRQIVRVKRSASDNCQQQTSRHQCQTNELELAMSGNFTKEHRRIKRKKQDRSKYISSKIIDLLAISLRPTQNIEQLKVTQALNYS